METTRAGIAIYKINYQSDFILTVVCDVEWGTPFCIKFWTGEPSQAYYVGWDGNEYRNCKVVESDQSKLLVLFDDHHLPVGELKMQIAYHTTIEDFPNAIVDEVTNSMKVMAYIDGKNQKVALDFEGEEAAELQFELPAYANEAQRIANEEQRINNEQQRIENEEARIAAETIRQQNEANRIAQETARVNEYAELKADAVAATDAANNAATLANQKAQLAADKAALADAAATLANQKAQLAADKAALADAAATLANQKAEYADAQGDYAKEQGDYAKEQGDTALADHRRAESDHETAASDHTIAANDHTQAGNDHTRAESDHSTAADDHTLAASDHSTAAADHTLAASDHSTAADDHTLAASDHSTAADDHTQAGNDHSRAESDHTRAESDHAAVEVHVDSLGAFDISSYHATGGALAKYADLTAALGTNGANIPEAIRKGGMSVKYVQSSDNKYVQYRLTSENWSSTKSDWQSENVDIEPTPGSVNLVTSGGTEAVFSGLENKINRLLVTGKNLYSGKLQGGKYIDQNGDITNTSYDLGISNIIPIIGGRTIYLSNNIAWSTVLNANVLDEDGEVLATIAYTGALKMSFTTATTAKYIQLSISYYSTVDSQQIMVSYEDTEYVKPEYNSISNIEHDRDLLLESLQKNKLGSYYKPFLIYSKYINANGGVATHTDYNATGFLPYDGNAVRYKNVAIGNVYVSSIVFYAADKTTITKKVVATSTNGVVEQSGIPDTTKYFRCSVLKNNTLEIWHQFDMEDKSYALEKGAFNSMFTPELIANKYLKADGTAGSSNNSYITDFIRWYGGNIAVEKLSGAAAISICFYSSANEDSFLGNSRLPNGNINGLFLEEQIPSGTYYFRLSTIYNDCKIGCQGIEQLLQLNRKVNTLALDGKVRVYKNSLASTERIDLPNIPSIKNNCTISFMANITTMGYIDIVKGISRWNRGHVRVTPTQIMVAHLNDDDWDTYNHGLTIEDYIIIRIEVGDSPKDAKIIVSTIDNATYSCTTTEFDGAAQECFAKANNGTELTNCELSFGIAKEDILIMSDSYSDLFPRYLNDYRGYQIDGYAGQQSAGAYSSLLKVLGYFYRPKTIVWMLGMNNADNSDSINASYKEYLDKVIELCNDYQIKLVVCTIPNTPTLRHTYKNTYIKEIGVSYIDVASMLSASNFPATWYSNYLSPDNIHPRAPEGCIAFAKILANGIPLMAK